jgi:hypothetical protein
VLTEGVSTEGLHGSTEVATRSDPISLVVNDVMGLMQQLRATPSA